MSRPVRVVMLLHAFIPETFGGAEQQARKLSAELVKRAASVTILAPRLFAATKPRELLNGVTVERFRLRNAPNHGGRHFFSFACWTLRTAWWLWRNRAAYDVIHIIHGRLHAVGPIIGGKLAGKPTLIKFGRGGEQFDIDVVQRKRLLGSLFARLITRHTTGFVANSAQMADDLARHNIGAERIHRIPNGVVMPDIGAREARGTEVRFIFMGRLDPEKAVDMMIRGFAALSPNTPARLTIVGDGPIQSDLEALADELGAASRIEFTGRVEDVAPILKASDFYLSTSLSEGMSNSLLEAMSFGVVPVVSRVSGVEDMVADGENGFLFEAGNLAGFVEALGKAISTDDLRYGEMSDAARRRLETGFSIESVVEQHLSLYRSVIAGERNGAR